jgi:hypothetical protein
MQSHSRSASKSSAQSCPKCKKPYGRKQDLRRHLLASHLPCSICCPYSSCPWRGDRPEDLQKHLKTEKCGSLNPKREEYEIYERSAILDWIFNRGQDVEMVASYALGVVEERALEIGKVKEWGDLWGHQWKADRCRRKKQRRSRAIAAGTPFLPLRRTGRPSKDSDDSAPT